MKDLLTQALGALALIILLAAPAAADDASQSVVTTPEASRPDSLNEPVEIQVPAKLPDRGFACVLPPQHQQDPCLCPLNLQPVCGCDGETYLDSCFARCQVRGWDEGACP